MNKNSFYTPDISKISNNHPNTTIELTNKRTQFSTCFANPDGSFTEVIYNTPQFYQDTQEKQWRKIDNTLHTVASNFENTYNRMRVKFKNKVSTANLLIISEGEKSISLNPVNANTVKGKVDGTGITYTNILPGTDLSYQLQGMSVKENIIFSQLPDNNTLTFELNLKGVIDVVEPDGTITFSTDDGDKIWVFRKPYLTDANNKITDKVTLVLRKEEQGTYLDVVADHDFLQDDSTQYPVVLDPTIDTWDVMEDTFVTSQFPTSTFSNLPLTYTGNDPSYYGIMRSLTKFFLPSLPSSSRILSASFNAYQTNSDTTNSTIGLHRITSNWGSSVTWNTQPVTNTAPESTTTNNAFNTYWQWDITQLVKDWYNGSLSNYGFVLKQQPETASFRSFRSVNSGNFTPSLSINYYIDALGIESFWSYTKDGVNPSNGNLVQQYTDFSIQGRGIPVSVVRTYNSRSLAAGIFGYGWRSNIELQVVDAGTGPITFIDSDGTRHIFGQAIDGTYTVAGGIYLTLVKHTDGTYSITQNNGTITNFNTTGNISSIVDTNNNITNYSYTSGRLSSITDASGRITTISYGTNGYVSSITYAGSRTVTYGYDANNNLTKYTNAIGKFITYGYDGNHNLTSITDERNITTETIAYDTANDRVSSVNRLITINGVVQTSASTYAYDTTNNVTSVVDGEGRRIDYTYNPNGNIVQTTENPLDPSTRAITTFFYDSNNNLTQIVDPNSNNAGGTSSYIYTYDSNGNITSYKQPENQIANYTYDSQNNLTQVNDFNNNITGFDYNANNNLTDIIDSNIQATASRYFSNGNTAYDTLAMSTTNNLIPNSSFEIFDSNNNASYWTKVTETGKTATFTLVNNPKFGLKSYSISNTTGWATIASSNIPVTIGQSYIVSAYYMAQNVVSSNRIIIKIEFFNSTNVKIGEQTYPYGLGAFYIADWARIQAVITSIPNGTSYLRVNLGISGAMSGILYFDGVQLEAGTVVSAYNLVENSSFERSTITSLMPDYWIGSSTLTAADHLDSSEKLVGSYSFKITGQSGINKFIRQRINLSGNGNSRFTLSGWSKQVGANPSGGYYELQIAINNTDGTTDWSNANDFRATTEGWQHIAVKVQPAQNKTFNSIDVYCYFYNQTGTAWFDAMRLEMESTITAYSYDTNGNYQTSVTDPYENEVISVFDAVGNVTSVTDAKNNTSSFAYNNINLLTQITDAKNGITSFEYDNAGNCVTVKDAKNHSTFYQYNEQNLLTSITNPLAQVTKFDFDKNGNTTKQIYPKGDTITYSFDALNRKNGVYYNGVQVWSYQYDRNSNITNTSNLLTGKSTAYTYDGNNQLTNVSEGSANSIGYGYDANDNLTTITATAGTTSLQFGATYDKLNQMIALQRNTTNLANIIYDERGNVVTIQRSNGIYTTLVYDALGRIVSIGNYNTGSTPFDFLLYSYDANGNTTNIITGVGNLSYNYDSLNQLVKETSLEGAEIDYQYDAAGNIVQKKYIPPFGSATTTTYTYNSVNELISVGTQQYTYDVNGNLINNGNRIFVYDEINQLKQVKDSAGNMIASFVYDDKGRRISATVSGVTTYFHYNDNNNKVIYETDAANNITAEYTWDSFGNPVTFTKNGVTYYYHLNAHGDTLGLTNSNGAIVATYEYDAWGNVTGQLGTMASANPYRYAGYRYDEYTGLYYLMARYYDPSIGRFINADNPLITKGLIDIYTKNPARFRNILPLIPNSYIYCANNPVFNIDPTGNATITIILKRDFLRDVVTASSSALGIIIATVIFSGTGPGLVYAQAIGGALGWIIGGTLTRKYINKDLKFQVWIPLVRSRTYTIY